MDISRITKVIWRKKIGKMTPLTVKNGIFKKIQKSLFVMGNGLLNNITPLGEKL